MSSKDPTDKELIDAANLLCEYIDSYFFGVWSPSGAGHYLFLPGGQRPHRLPSGFPFNRYEVLDGTFLPVSKDQPEGESTFFHINGWTVISFWDRSGDSRFASNSAFLVRGVMTFEAACQRARERFPSIWERFQFEVYQRAA